MAKDLAGNSDLVTFSLSSVQIEILKTCIAVKLASVNRAITAASTPAVRSAYQSEYYSITELASYLGISPF